jgi:adenylosuccinate synthase
LSLIGLGFGDCGKGLFTDHVCRHWARGSVTVVRYNGGAQAGHNVVLPDGRHHTFSQFAAGSFVPNVWTVLAFPVIVHPTALLVEHEHLVRQGVVDAFARLLVDSRCLVTTPFHQALGRLRELARAANAHGSCGAGVGETVRHAQHRPAQALRYGELSNESRVRDKVTVMQRSLLEEAEQALADATFDARAAPEWASLRDARVGERWIKQVMGVAARVPGCEPDRIAERLQRSATVVFEGAQGALLDEWAGFHPHTTWSSVGPAAVRAVADDAGIGDVKHFGVLRSYLTRHGAGPMPTHDPGLDALPEDHNASDGWQGRFRRGHPDAVLLAYARLCTGPLDGLFVSHLDAFDANHPPLRWCHGYRIDGDCAGAAFQRSSYDVDRVQSDLIVGLRRRGDRDLDHQATLTRLLGAARPVYEHEALRDATALIRRFEEVAGCRVRLGSFGPSHETVRSYAGLDL